jgi:hypothetical protein
MSLSKWRVAHTFSPPVRLLDRTLPTIEGVTFVADDGGLQTVLHDLELAASASREEAEKQSRNALEGAVAALRYLQVRPLNHWSEATRITPPESGLRFVVRATGTVGTRAIALPGKGWSADLPAEVLTWLVIAAQAQESQSPAVRVRLYFMILEDLRDRGELTDSAAQAEYHSLKPVRDFVSHPRITSPTTLARLRLEAPALANSDGTFAYNPRSGQQNAELLALSDRARRIVDAILLRAVGVRGNYWG